MHFGKQNTLVYQQVHFKNTDRKSFEENIIPSSTIPLLDWIFCNHPSQRVSTWNATKPISRRINKGWRRGGDNIVGSQPFIISLEGIYDAIFVHFEFSHTIPVLGLILGSPIDLPSTTFAHATCSSSRNPPSCNWGRPRRIEVPHDVPIPDGLVVVFRKSFL